MTFPQAQPCLPGKCQQSRKVQTEADQTHFCCRLPVETMGLIRQRRPLGGSQQTARMGPRPFRSGVAAQTEAKRRLRCDQTGRAAPQVQAALPAFIVSERSQCRRPRRQRGFLRVRTGDKPGTDQPAPEQNQGTENSSFRQEIMEGTWGKLPQGQPAEDKRGDAEADPGRARFAEEKAERSRGQRRKRSPAPGGGLRRQAGGGTKGEKKEENTAIKLMVPVRPE